MKTKLTMWGVTLCLLSSLFFSLNVWGAEHFSFKDDFSGYTDATYTGYNVNMQDNWRTANEGEVASKYSTVPIGYGNGKLKINTNTNNVSEKYTSVRSKNFPTAVLTADLTNLTPSQKISVKVNKTHGSDMWGIRFYVHNGSSGKLNYYTLLFGGMYTVGYDTTKSAESGYLTWGLYKSTNETVVTLKEKTRSSIGSENDVNGYMGSGNANLEIEISGNTITWNLTYVNGGTTYTYSDSYTDANMFDVSGVDTTVHLYAAGSTNSSRYVYFDDFKIETNWNAPEFSELSGTVDAKRENNVIFTNCAQGITTDANGVMDLGAEFVIDEIYSETSELPEMVLVSKDNSTWYKLADKDDFNGQEFLNTVTKEGYRYLYAGGEIQHLKFLSKVESLDVEYTNTVAIYPRVNGINYFDNPENIVTIDDESVAFLDGNIVRANGLGTVQVIATNGTEQAVLEINFYSTEGGYVEPDFVVYQNLLRDATESNGIYTLTNDQQIFRVIATNVSDNLEVYASNDLQRWYKIAAFVKDGDRLNSLYNGEFKYIKTSGIGNIQVLGQLEGQTVHVFPGESFEVYTYINGQRETIRPVCQSQYVSVQNTAICLSRNLKDQKVSISSANAVKYFWVNSKLVDFRCDVDYFGKNAEVTLAVDSLKNDSAIVQITKYNADKSLKSISFESVSFQNGEAVIVISNVNQIGAYTTVRVMNESFLPLTNTITIN